MGRSHAHAQRVCSACPLPVLDSGAQERSSFDVVVDCTGTPAGLQAALGLVKPRGLIVLKSTYASGSDGARDLDLSALVVKEIRVVGSRCGPFAVALRFLSSGKINPLPLLAAEYPLAQADLAFQAAAKPGALKILIRP
jgi:threonine dehydrogenase-like Zn-dependent dehydrogenase